MVISSGPSSATRSKTSIYAPSITQHFPSAIHSNDKNNPTNQLKDDNKPIMTRFGQMVRPVQKYVNTTVLPTEVHATNLKKLLQIENRKEAIQKAIEEEIDNLMATGVMEATTINLIDPIHRKDIINLWLFHKEKKDSNGTFLKDKCRIVTLSQVRDLSTIGDTYSPTVNPISLFILVAKEATLPHYSISSSKDRRQRNFPELSSP